MVALLSDPGFFAPDVVARQHPQYVRRLQGCFQLSVGSLCDMRCGYCCASGSSPGTSASLAAVLAEAARGLAAGKRFPLLMGGEPLVYPDLWALLPALAARGLPEFAVLTNGTRLADAAVCDRLAAAGCVLTILSFDDFDPVRLGQMVRRPGHHAVLLAALRNVLTRLLGPSAHLVLQVCVTKVNFEHLPDLVRSVAAEVDREGADRARITFNLNNVQVNGRARDNAGEFVADLRRVVPRVQAAVDAAVGLGMHALVRDFPMCTLPAELEGRNSNLLFKDYLLDGSRLVDWFATLSTKKPGCARCRYERFCSGYFSGYGQLFSDDVFQPITGASA